MKFIQHPSNNLLLGAPDDWDQGKLAVGALPATRIEQDGVTQIASFWMPDEDELRALNAGCPVILFVVGETQPPVAIAVAAEPVEVSNG